MNFLLVIGRIAFFVSAMVLWTCAQTPVQKDNHSIAIILRIAGEGENISEVSLHNYTLFNGRVKSSDKNYSGDNSLHIKVKDDKDSTLYDNYLENPLLVKFESFNPDGTIERSEALKQENYINLRFKINQDSKFLKVYCYRFRNNEEEKPISEFKLDLK